jgi:hypothetical protein
MLSSRWLAPIGLRSGCGFAEQQPKSGTGRSEARRRRHRKIELQSLRQQENAVHRRPSLEVDEWQRPQLICQRASPVVEDLSHRRILCDGERQVEVGEGITAAKCEGPDGRSRNDSLVLVGKGQHAIA